MAGTYDKARAVFLAALMVVSVFGGTLAFAGTAAAAASGLTVDDGAPAQPDGTITVSTEVSANGNEASFIILDSNGDTSSITSVTDGSASDADGSEDGVVTAELALVSDFGDGNTNPADGEATVYATEGSSVNTGDADDSATFEVDGTNPTSDYQYPSGDIDTNEPVVDIALADETAGINESSIQVDITSDSDGEIFTYSMNTGEVGDGVNYDNGNVTVDFSNDNIPTLPDDTITADVYVEDNAGNTYTATTTFTVDTTPVEINRVSPSEDYVGEPTQTIEVNFVSGADSSVDSAEITVEGEDGYSVTNDTSDGVYDSGNEKFVLQPGTSTGIAELPNGTVTVTTNVTDENGNEAEESFSFVMDNHAPETESGNISVSGTEDGVINDSERDDVEVTVTFDEQVVPSTVTGEVQFDGGDPITLGNTSDTAASTVVLTGNDIPSDIEDDSASVNITAADDQLENSFSGDVNVTFAIDTANASVTDDGLPSPVSGYVDLTDDVTVEGADGNDPVYMIAVGQDTDNVVVIENPSNLDTQTLPEGNHTLAVYAEDDVGNSDHVTVDTFTVDNEDPVVDYVGNDPITGDVNLTESFTVEGAGVEDVSYQWALDAKTDSDGEYNNGNGDSDFNVNNVGEGEYKFTVTVDDPGFEGESNDVSASFHIDGESLDLVNPETGADSTANGFTVNANDDGTVTVNVTSDVALDGLNVTAETDDNYYEQSEMAYTLDEDFSQVDSEYGYKYTLTTDELADGAYQFTFENASAQQQTIESDYTRSPTVDAATASVVDADVIDGGEDQLVVNVTFSEPVAQDSVTPSDFSVEGVDTSAIAVSDTAAQGYVEVTFDSEFQTGDGPTLVVADGGVTEATGAGDASAEQTETIHTVELNLEEGLNIVSIPAEAGDVSLDSLNLGEKNVDSVMEYDKYYDDDWAAYDAQTGEGDLQYLQGGDGYVIKADSSTEIDLNAYNVPSSSDGEPGVPSSEQVEAGWNLLGHFQEGDQTVDKALSTIDVTPAFSGGGNVVTVLEATSGYNFVETNTLKQNGGYWVFVEESDIYAPVDYAAGDTVAPTVDSVTVKDSDQDDDVVGHNEAISISATVSGYEAGTITADLTALGGDGAVALSQEGSSNTYSTTFTPADSFDKDVEPSITVTASNANGRQAYGSDSITVNANAPEVSSIETIDRDGNGAIDGANVVFSEPIDDGTLTAGDWTIGGTPVDSVAPEVNSGANDDTIQLQMTQSEISGTDAKDVTYSPGSTADLDGNALDAVASGDVTEDDSAVPLLSSSTPTSGATGISTSTDVSLTFSENVQVDTGSVVIKKYSGDSTVETIDVTGDKVSVTDATVTVKPGTTLDDNTQYYVTVDSGAFNDSAGNAYAGISSKDTLEFTTADNSPTYATDSPSVSATGADAFELSVASSGAEDLTAYYVVVGDDDGTPPTASEIKSGSGAGSEATYGTGSLNLDSGNSYSSTTTVTDNTAETYDVYVALEDDDGNLVNVVRVDASTTNAA